MTGDNKSDKRHFGVDVNSKVRDYGNDPFFVKKANESKQFLEKHGLPKAFQKRTCNTQ